MNALGLARKNGYPTRALLQFGATRLINQALNPATYPEYIETYRSPVINANNQFISTWPEFNSYFSYTPPSRTCTTCWKQDENIDHSYGFIAMAALSYMSDLTVGGKTGLQAWDSLKMLKPLQNRFGTDSPKWAIVPQGRTFFP